MHRAVTILCVMVLTFGVYGIAKGFQGKAGRDMSPVEAEKALKGDSTLVVLDVRTSDEFGSETGHLRGARLIPVQELDKRIGRTGPRQSQDDHRVLPNRTPEQDSAEYVAGERVQRHQCHGRDCPVERETPSGGQGAPGAKEVVAGGRIQSSSQFLTLLLREMLPCGPLTAVPQWSSSLPLTKSNR